MTVSSIIPVNNYKGNGSNKKFDFDFLIESANEIEVTHISQDGISQILIQGVDYSVNEIGNKNGSYIIFPLEQSTFDILQEGETISLVLSLEIKQESEFENSSNLNLSVLEWTFDYIIRIIQMLTRRIERAVKVTEGVSTTPDELVSSLNESQKKAYEAAIIANEKAQAATEASEKSVTASEQAVVTANKALTVLDNTLKKNYLSNCIIEIPHNIQWEYVKDGDVTLIKLKAGSKVTIPNGFEEDGVTKKFIYKTITQDLTLDGQLLGHKLYCLYNNNTNKFTSAIPYECTTSGTYSPTAFFSNGYACWYDTSTNLIKVTTDSGVNYTSGYSLPLFLIDTTINTSNLSGGITNLQFFNGLGFIGSLTFVEKGVKTVFADGLNEDGTNNNIEYIFSETCIYDLSGQASFLAFLTKGEGLTGYGVFDYYEQSNIPSMSGNYAIWYDTATNTIKSTTNAGETWTQVYRFFIGSLLKNNNSKILSFNPIATPLKISTNESLAYRDLKKIGDPILTLSSILEDGEIWLEGATVSRTAYKLLFARYGEIYGAGDGTTTFTLPDFRSSSIWGSISGRVKTRYR